MCPKSAEFGQEKGQRPVCQIEWVGGFPCRGQEAPQSALHAVSRKARPTVKPRVGLCQREIEMSPFLAKSKCPPWL